MASVMKGLVYKGLRDVDVVEMPVPKAGENELVIHPLAVGVCISDKHAHDYGWGYYHSGMVIGHEGCGVVTQVGEGVTGWNIGELVSINPTIHCGHCIACVMGYYSNCRERSAKRLGSYLGIDALRSPDGSLYHGLLADYCVVPERNCFKLIPNTDVISASNIEMIAEALKAVRCSGVQPGDNVVLLGMEDTNALVMQFIPKTQLVVVDPYPVRQEMAKRLGASHVLDPTVGNIGKEIMNIFPFGADIVFVSTEDYIEPSLRYPVIANRVVRLQGTIVLARFYLKGNIGDGLAYSFSKEATIKLPGQFSESLNRGGRTRSEYQMVIDGINSGKIDGSRHVSRVVPFESIRTRADMAAIFAMIPEKENKIVIKMT